MMTKAKIVTAVAYGAKAPSGLNMGAKATIIIKASKKPTSNPK